MPATLSCSSRAPAAGPSSPARRGRPRRWWRRRNPRSSAGSAARGSPARSPGCAQANISRRRSSGISPLAAAALPPPRRSGADGRTLRSASSAAARHRPAFAAPTVSSHASGFSGTPERGPVAERRRERLGQRILGAGDVARTRREEGDQLAIAPARHRLRGFARMVAFAAASLLYIPGQIGRTSIAPN